MRKFLSLSIVCILLIYVVITPCLNDNYIYKNIFTVPTISNLNNSFSVSTNCLAESENQEVIARLNLVLRSMFNLVIERKPIRYRCISPIVILIKFRPQEARRNTNDENSNIHSCSIPYICTTVML